MADETDRETRRRLLHLETEKEEKRKQRERELLMSLWEQKDDSAIIIETATKGNHINTCINFLAKRKSISLIEAKDYYLKEVFSYCFNLVDRGQFYKAEHIFKNSYQHAFITAYLHFLYQAYNEADDKNKSQVFDHLMKYPEFVKADRFFLEDHYNFFKLIRENLTKVAVTIEKLNVKYGGSFKPNILLFHLFMKENTLFHQRLAVDLMFKMREMPKSIQRFIDKEVLWLYLLKNDMFCLIKLWIREQHKKRNQPTDNQMELRVGSFETMITELFNKFDIDKAMVDQLGRYRASEKDIILNELAKLGLFIPKESKNIFKLLQRIFKSQTLDENSGMISKEEIVGVILQNNLVDLLAEPDLIDYNILQEAAGNNCMINSEVNLIVALKELLSSSNNSASIATMSKFTSSYLSEIAKNFEERNVLVRQFEEFMTCKEFNKKLIADTHFWKVFKPQKPESDIAKIFQKFHHVNLNYLINSQSASTDNERLTELAHFDNASLQKKFSSDYQLTYNDYIKKYASSNLALYKYLIENHLVKDEMKLNQIPRNVAEMTINNFEDSNEILAHSVAFIEMLGYDTSGFRRFLRFLKIKSQSNDSSNSLGQDQQTNCTALRNIEAVNAFHDARFIPKYLKKILQNNDWLKLVLLAQYLNFPIEKVRTLCHGNFENQFVERNVTRAMLCEPTTKKSQSHQKLLDPARFLNSKMDRDLISVLLQTSVKNDDVEQQLTVSDFIELYDLDETDFSNLFNLSITVKDDDDYSDGKGWPLLSILAAMTKTCPLEYCWINYLILTANYPVEDADFSDFYSLMKSVCSFCVTSSCHQELLLSLQIFYPDINFLNLAKFFVETSRRDFQAGSKHFQQFVGRIDNDIWIFDTEEKFHEFCAILTNAHLTSNFKTTLDVYNVLDALCKGRGYSLRINFVFLKEIFQILKDIPMAIEFDWLKLENYNQSLCNKLVDRNEFSVAIELANQLKCNKTIIIYRKWKYLYEQEAKSFDINKCEHDLEIHNIDADVLVSFYLYIASQMECGKFKEKYLILKRALDAIKSYNLHSSETFDKDRIEYDLVMSYLKIPEDDLKEIAIYHSEYYEVISKKNRNLVFHSFMELREFAQIDDMKVVDQVLTDSDEINRFNGLIAKLLDKADLVQCLRLQVMFGHRPVDLNFTVFILALVEDLTSLTELPKEERQAICSSKSLLSSARSKLNYRWKIENNFNENFNSETIDKESFVENILAIQGILDKMENGVNVAMRAFLMYRAAYYTSNPYLTLIKTQNIHELLDTLTKKDCPNKVLMIHDVMVVNGMSDEEISEFVAQELFRALAFCRFGIQNDLESNESLSASPKTVSQSDKMWGFNLDNDFHMLLELVPKSTLLGETLLVYYDMFDYYRSKIYFTGRLAESIHRNSEKVYLRMHSLKKQNTMRVELLIKAHECFVKECSMEGIGKCLEKARELTNILATAKSFNLIVRLLYGIGRYREMYYCFDILIKHDQFEALLGQFPEKYSIGLKSSLIAYLNEYHPHNKEFYSMAVSHFSMHFEMAQRWEYDAKEMKADLIEIEAPTVSTFSLDINVPHLLCNKDLVDTLSDIMGKLMNSAEFYLLDNKYEIAQTVATQAELFALQISLARRAMNTAKNTKTTCISLINITDTKLFRYFVNYELNVQQALILERAYDFEIDWKTVIFTQFLKLGNENYLRNYLNVRQLNDHMIEKIAKMYQMETQLTKEMEKGIVEIVEKTQNIVLKFKLATMLGLKSITSNLMNSQGIYYLKDTNYGRQEIL